MALKKNFTYTSDFQKASFGGFGHDFLAAGETSPVGITYIRVEAWEDSVISYTSTPEASDMNGAAHDTSQTSLAIGDGKAIMGRLSAITVVSGKVVCYLG